MEEVQDLYRDTSVRYLGYANEVGEAFRPLVQKKVVNASYLIATAYVLADVVDKAYKKKKEHERSPNKWNKVLICAGDSLLWQTLASIIIPGFTINRICAGSVYLLNRTPLARHAKVPAAISTVIGLLSIPFIIHPIDDAVTYLMDNTYRKVYD